MHCKPMVFEKACKRDGTSVLDKGSCEIIYATLSKALCLKQILMLVVRFLSFERFFILLIYLS